MERRENQRVMLTKRMLLDALVDMLENKEIGEISVTELCRHAGVNRTTFYKHYSTPNDILTELAQRHVNGLAEVYRTRTGSVVDQIEAGCAYLYRNADAVCLLMRSRMDEIIPKAVFQELIQLIPVQPVFSANLDAVECTLVLTYIANGCYFLIRKWLMEDVQKTPREIAQLIFQLSTRGWLPAVFNENKKV